MANFDLPNSMSDIDEEVKQLEMENFDLRDFMSEDSNSNSNEDSDDEEGLDKGSDSEVNSKKLEEDRISKLPKGLMADILSFLPTTKEAIRTGILSSKWKSVWTLVSKLTFNQYEPTEMRISDFISIVSETLNQRPILNLKKLTIDFNYERDFAAVVNQWIDYGLSCHVEKLYLDFDHLDKTNLDNCFLVPEKLFTSTYLTKLTLHFCIVRPAGPINWKNLRKLVLVRVNLGHDVIEKIQAGSPLLETLDLELCYGFDRLDITSVSVRNLILWDYPNMGGDGIVLKISAPNVLSLDIYGTFFVREILLVDVSSLVKVTLMPQSRNEDTNEKSIQREDLDMFKGILQSLRHVKELTLGSFGLQMLSALELEQWHSPPSSLQCLNITRCIRRSCFPGLVNLLQASPDLESLAIITRPIKKPDYCGHYAKENYLTWQRRSFQCLKSHLKTLSIVSVVEWDPDCELIKFLLQNSCVLEKMNIYLGTKDPSKSTVLPHLASKLSRCPKASKDAVVLFFDCTQRAI